MSITLESTEFEITDVMTKFLIQTYLYSIYGVNEDNDDNADSVDDARLYGKMIKVFLKNAVESGLCTEETVVDFLQRTDFALQQCWKIGIQDC